MCSSSGFASPRTTLSNIIYFDRPAPSRAAWGPWRLRGPDLTRENNILIWPYIASILSYMYKKRTFSNTFVYIIMYTYAVTIVKRAYISIYIFINPFIFSYVLRHCIRLNRNPLRIDTILYTLNNCAAILKSKFSTRKFNQLICHFHSRFV